MMTNPAIPSAARTTIIFTFCAAAAYALCNLQSGDVPVGIGLGAVFLMSTPFLHRMRALAVQILVRAAWWQAAFVGALFWVGTDSSLAPMMLLGAVGAAITAGTRGLRTESGSFEPAAYRKTLMASLVLATADLIALAVYLVVWVEYTITWPGAAEVLGTQTLLFVGSATAMSAAVLGLYRLRIWGLVTCIIANIAIATLACTGAFGLREFLAAGLTATAVTQLLIPLPLIHGMWRARKRS